MEIKVWLSLYEPILGRVSSGMVVGLLYNLVCVHRCLYEKPPTVYSHLSVSILHEYENTHVFLDAPITVK